MQFESVSEFIAMGGHGGYIWSVYALIFIGLAYNLLQPRLALSRIIKSQRGLLLRQDALEGNNKQQENKIVKKSAGRATD